MLSDRPNLMTISRHATAPEIEIATEALQLDRKRGTVGFKH